MGLIPSHFFACIRVVTIMSRQRTHRVLQESLREMLSGISCRANRLKRPEKQEIDPK